MKEFSCLTPGCKLYHVESLRSNLSILLPTVDSLWMVSQQKGENADEKKNNSEEDECSLADRVASYRNTFQIYTFFLIHIVLIEESKSSSNNTKKVTTSSRKKQLVSTWNWESQRAMILNSVENSLEINHLLILGSSDPDENDLSFIVINAFSVFENAVIFIDSETKDALTHIIGTCATNYQIPLCCKIMCFNFAFGSQI